MPHQCVRCGAIYPDGDKALLEGCPKCHGRFFFFVRKEKIKEAQEFSSNLSDTEKEQMENDVLDLIGEKVDENQPVVLDFESIRVSKPGKYEIDLVDIFNGRPLVYKVGEGKYIIDIVKTLESAEKEQKNEQ